MGTLYIDRRDGHIRLDGNALAFYSGGDREGTVPIKPLKRVVIIGNITIDASVLHRLADNDISVLFLSGKRGRFCGMLHGRLHNNGLLRVRQYEKCMAKGEDSGILFPVRFSLDIILRKINAQAGLLRDAMNSRADLRLPLKTAVNILEGVTDSMKNLPVPECHSEFISGSQTPFLDTIRGYEGGASAAYFSAYTKLFPESLGFKKRTRRPPEDPVNALLSLCYTLLHYEMVRETEVIGLDPTIGFYHQFEYGRESLACDLVEVFRPEVDRFVWTIFRERIFAGRDFSREDERPGCYLKKNSRSRFYPLYEEWAQGFRTKFKEEVRCLARDIMGGDSALQGYLPEESVPTVKNTISLSEMDG